MRILNRNINHDEGSVTMRPEEPEDLWHCYNLISEGDEVRTTTVRKVKNESSTGSSTSERVRTTLTLAVDGVDFDPDACALRVRGRNVGENQHVRMGAHHTLELLLHQKFELSKQWDALFYDRLDTAANPAQAADVAALVMAEGLANLCLITEHMTIVRARIEVTVPRKRAGSSRHAGAMRRFMDACYEALRRHVDFGVVQCMLLAGPGFVKDDFYEYVLAEAVRREDRAVIENKAKFVRCHASSGYKHALDEVLQQPAVQAQLRNTKAATDVRALQEFYEMMGRDPDRAFYGEPHVRLAVDQGAVDTLMITDKLFRNRDFAARQRFVDIVEMVKAAGGTVRVFSGLHVSGEQLEQLSGIAAVLRFPIPLDDVDDDSDSEFEIEWPEEDYPASSSAVVGGEAAGAGAGAGAGAAAPEPAVEGGEDMTADEQKAEIDEVMADMGI